MLNTLYTYINEGSVYYGLEISEHHGDINYHLIEIKRKKQELYVEREESFSTLENIPLSIRKDAPVFLVINTGNVLTKIERVISIAKHESVVDNAFPNLDFNSFYFELVQSRKNTLISICKKEQVDTHLKRLVELKINVVDISLGISSIAIIENYIQTDSLNVSNAQLVFKEENLEKVISFSEVKNIRPDTYEINGLKVINSSLLGFASLLTHLLKSKSSVTNFADTLLNLKKEFTNKRYFGLLLKTFLIFVLGILFINFLLFNHYYQKVGKLQEDVAINSTNKSRLIQLKASVKSKEDKINAVLSASNSKTSFYLDQIAQNIPFSVLLSAIEYQPLEKPLRETKPIEISKNTLLISGEVINNSDFYTWITELEGFSWIKNVETTDYDYSKTNTSNFTIKIKIDGK